MDFTPAAERNGITVLAPHLLRPGVEAALQLFRDRQTDPVYVVRYGTCADVARSAAAGEAAIVLTGHPSWAQYVAEKAEVVERAVLGSDALVVIGPGIAAAERPLQDPSALLSGPEIVGIPSTESESVGMYAREALLRYGIWSRMEQRLHSFSSVEQALAALDAGTVDAVLTARSTARREGRRILLGLEPAFHQPIRYEVLLLDDSSADARALFDHLVGPAGRSAFLQAGFDPAE